MSHHRGLRAVVVSAKGFIAVSLFCALGCGLFTAKASAVRVFAASSTAYAFSGGSTPSSTGFSAQAGRAYDFVDSIAINTHFSYTNTAYYEQPAVLISKIQALHIRHIRDGLAYYWVPPNLYAIYSKLAAAGIYADLVLPNPSTAGPTSDSIKALLPHYPALDAIEGPNEYDLAGNGQWPTTLRNYLPTIWTVGEKVHLPVFGPSLTQIPSYSELGNVSAYISYGNYHAYWGGRNPETTGWGGPDSSGNYYGSLFYDLDQLAIDSPERPDVITETGYVVNNMPSQNIIPESVEAIYEPRLFLHFWNMGIKRTYIYELMDDPSSTAGIGLLRADLTPRPAYTALATLTSLLADSSATFTPQKLTYSLSGDTTGVETTLLQKHDGSFWMAIWQNAAIFDVNAVKPITISPRAMTLSVPPGLLIKTVWTLNGAGNSASRLINNTATSLSVQSAVTLVEIAK